MARAVEGPWFRVGKGTWYATINGRKVSLGVKGDGNRADAVRAWHKLMADGPPEVVKVPKPKAEPVTVKGVADAFLTDGLTRLKAPTMRLYRLHLGAFASAVGGVQADALTPQHVARWLHTLPHGPTTKAMMLRSVSACLGWATANGMMTANPAVKVSKPKSKSRTADAVITDADHERLMATASPAVRPVLAVLHATGCRPGEACRVTAADVDVENGVIMLADHKADWSGKPRVIFLPPSVMVVVQEHVLRHPDGPIFRTRTGRPWNAQSINLAVRKAAKRAGIGAAMPYGYRHAFATSALANGVPDAQVAALLGHTSTAVLHRHYSHLTAQAQAMREALAQVRG